MRNIYLGAKDENVWSKETEVFAVCVCSVGGVKG